MHTQSLSLSLYNFIAMNKFIVLETHNFMLSWMVYMKNNHLGKIRRKKMYMKITLDASTDAKRECVLQKSSLIIYKHIHAMWKLLFVKNFNFSLYGYKCNPQPPPLPLQKKKKSKKKMKEKHTTL